jgi:hypothetical protein
MGKRIIEVVAMHDYEIRTQRPSALGLKEQVDVATGFHCPRCNCPVPMIEHGKTGNCPNCNLYFQLWGNGLHCSDMPFKDHVTPW